jgi:putative endonuclease
MSKYAFIYILSNEHNTVLYIGVTNDISRRFLEHQSRIIPGFTKRYNVSKMVYFEEYCSIEDAIAREKQLKKWSRKKKEMLIGTMNRSWRDLGGVKGGFSGS